MRNNFAACLGLLLALSSTPVLAYIGPGLGAGALAVVFGIIASVFVAFLAVFWYPIKRLFKKKKNGAGPSVDEGSVSSEANMESPVEQTADNKPADN